MPHERCLVVLLAGLLTLAGCGSQETDDPQQVGDEIRQALGDVRPIEPRLILDTGWAPCAAAPRTSTASAGCSSAGLLRTELPAPRCSPPPTRATPGFREIFDIVRRHGRRSLQKDGALAALPLFLRTDERATRETIADLVAAGRHPDALSDLSAAYLHLAGIVGRPELLLASLEASSESLELRPDFPPALFNRALALSRLNLTATARLAWMAYLVKAPEDGWAAEAKGFLARSASSSYQQRWLSEVEPALREAALRGDLPGVRSIVARHRQRSREWAERDLIREWAAGGDKAGESLTIAGRIGDALAGMGGDRMLSAGIDAIAAAGDTAKGDGLRAGHRELAAGVEALSGNWELGQARDHLRRAHDDLAASPFALWADFHLARVSYYQNDYGRAAGSLKALKARIDPARYPALYGRVLWIEALAAGATFRLKAAAELYQRSLQTFCAAGEDENLAAVHALLGEISSRLGRFEESWHHLYDALAKSDRIFDPAQHHIVLQVAIINAHRQGLDRAGLAFVAEHLPVARRARNPQMLNYGLMHRATFRYALGDLPEAKADLDEAERVAGGIKDPNLRQRSAAHLELVSAEIEVETDPRSAVTLLRRTIKEYKNTQFSYLLPQAYGARARAFRRLGKLTAAERDLADEIRIFEGSADETQQDIFRLSLLDQAAPAFDAMIELQATQLKHPVRGLEYCERGRYRAFLSSWAQTSRGLSSRRRPISWPGFDPRRFRTGLPPGVAILELSLLDDHLLSWVITRSGIEMIASTVKREEVARRVRELDRGLARERAPAASRELYDLLVRPIAPLLGGVSHLVVVPDKELFRVPFEALVDRQTGRFLVEDRMVSYAPSASLYVHLQERVRTRTAAPERIVAATGALDGGFKYERLPQAPAEAHSIAVLYSPHGSVLENPSKESFLTALARSQVLHFSGHAISNSEQPFASKLVLADTPQEQVELYAWELYDRAFPHLELVVLSACGTAEAVRPGLGMAATLAGPFLAAGVPQVIGSQWRVKDEPTRRFFAAFHGRFAQGADAATALRATKLELLRSGDPDLASPRVWAAFVLVGG